MTQSGKGGNKLGRLDVDDGPGIKLFDFEFPGNVADCLLFGEFRLLILGKDK